MLAVFFVLQATLNMSSSATSTTFRTEANTGQTRARGALPLDTAATACGTCSERTAMPALVVKNVNTLTGMSVLVMIGYTVPFAVTDKGSAGAFEAHAAGRKLEQEQKEESSLAKALHGLQQLSAEVLRQAEEDRKLFES
jgi:hypothetical protein